jgi:hypothetical protein
MIRYRTNQVTKKVPRKVLRYIPIIPGLRRLFRCKRIAQFMDYHANNISKYGVLRMSANGSSFKKIEEIWPHFKVKPRNLRLSLATNDVNPFGELKSTYSLWLVFVMRNKIPPWMSIKRELIMFTMIILGICLEYFSFNTITSHLSSLFNNYVWYFFIYSYM